MDNPKFQIFRGENDEFYFRLRARNGEIILQSEGYVNKAGCINGIASVKENAPDDEHYKRETADDGQLYFVLVAANGEPIGTSEMYTTDQARENGIEAVRGDAPAAPTEDTTL
ncbi:MAG: YegP family protein [Fidelibacterota bacterium]|nr:MAG: YegP family protein [Candidatus Neomarinimicrobiota bacterium]